jgi:predicted hotdog family 3-hydroxylacyl-ACP dehydratase
MNIAVPIGREQLLELIPHAGAMCLFDRVIEYSGEEIVCEASSHRDPANPLRRAQGLSTLHLAEYAAQAAAAHGALKSDGVAQPGMLAALRDIRLYVERIHDIPGNLIVRAHRRLARREGSMYDFSVLGDGRLLCEGRIVIALG